MLDSVSTNQLAADEDFDVVKKEVTVEDVSPPEVAIVEEEEEEVMEEEDEEGTINVNAKPPSGSDKLNNYLLQHKQKHIQYRWRIDLSKTETFWVGWFQGMSQKFIDLPISKVLLLANLTMDTALTRAQMEGLQFFIFPKKKKTFSKLLFQVNFNFKYCNVLVIPFKRISRKT